MAEPIFKASHIVKQFGPTIALNDVSIEIYPGEIRGFIGENGSGKSTMSAIRTGIYQATSGQREYHGKPWKPKSMIEALQGGIGIIVQENGTIAEVSVAENIFLGELKNFSGKHYFEDEKVENFSPAFSVSLNEFDALAKDLVSKSLAALDAGNKAEYKKAVQEAKKGPFMLLMFLLLSSRRKKLRTSMRVLPKSSIVLLNPYLTLMLRRKRKLMQSTTRTKRISMLNSANVVVNTNII